MFYSTRSEVACLLARLSKRTGSNCFSGFKSAKACQSDHSCRQTKCCMQRLFPLFPAELARAFKSRSSEQRPGPHFQ